jgi:hypothetical protein
MNHSEKITLKSLLCEWVKPEAPRVPQASSPQPKRGEYDTNNKKCPYKNLFKTQFI